MKSAAVEALYRKWLEAPDDAARQAWRAELQEQLAQDVPFVPHRPVLRPDRATAARSAT